MRESSRGCVSPARERRRVERGPSRAFDPRLHPRMRVRCAHHIEPGNVVEIAGLKTGRDPRGNAHASAASPPWPTRNIRSSLPCAQKENRPADRAPASPAPSSLYLKSCLQMALNTQRALIRRVPSPAQLRASDKSGRRSAEAPDSGPRSAGVSCAAAAARNAPRLHTAASRRAGPNTRNALRASPPGASRRC